MNKFKTIYPATLTISKDGVSVIIKDLSLETQGEDIVEAIQKARNLIGITGMVYIENNLKMPEPSIKEHMVNAPFMCDEKTAMSLIDIDLEEYRQKAKPISRIELPCSEEYDGERSIVIDEF